MFEVNSCMSIIIASYNHEWWEVVIFMNRGCLWLVYCMVKSVWSDRDFQLFNSIFNCSTISVVSVEHQVIRISLIIQIPSTTDVTKCLEFCEPNQWASLNMKWLLAPYWRYHFIFAVNAHNCCHYLEVFLKFLSLCLWIGQLQERGKEVQHWYGVTVNNQQLPEKIATLHFTLIVALMGSNSKRCHVKIG